VHYIPVYYHPYYQKLGYKIGQCPIAEEYYSQAMTIPLFPKMKNSDVKYVIKSVEEVIRKHVK
jgi:dTDP-4-amino-4,6-dideoxygalactose transaminase